MTRAAEESDRISERVQRAKLRRATLTGLAPEPGDFRPAESAERVEAEREIVRDAYRRLLAGTTTLVRLAGELNDRGRDGERAALPVSGGFWT